MSLDLPVSPNSLIVACPFRCAHHIVDLAQAQPFQWFDTTGDAIRCHHPVPCRVVGTKIFPDLLQSVDGRLPPELPDWIDVVAPTGPKREDLLRVAPAIDSGSRHAKTCCYVPGFQQFGCGPFFWPSDCCQTIEFFASNTLGKHFTEASSDDPVYPFEISCHKPSPLLSLRGSRYLAHRFYTVTRIQSRRSNRSGLSGSGSNPRCA